MIGPEDAAVTTVQATTLDAALAALAERPDLLPVAGGTDLMVDVNFDRLRPTGLLDVTAIGELSGWKRHGDELSIGSATTFTTIVDELSELAPALALASRTVGSPQIRNRGTIGGNLGTASPAGDALPALVACGASVEVASTDGRRTIPADEWVVAPRRSALRDGELIVGVTVPVARGPQQFAKVGSRNAMVISVTGLAVAVDTTANTIGTGIGSAGPVILRAREAEEWFAQRLDHAGGWNQRGALSDDDATAFGALVSQAARPIDDVRGTADYRRHALEVLGRRLLRWCWYSEAVG
jgi:CO/xanthine dehydrogenase FAD-binding subunit